MVGVEVDQHVLSQLLGRQPREHVLERLGDDLSAGQLLGHHLGQELLLGVHRHVEDGGPRGQRPPDGAAELVMRRDPLRRDAVGARQRHHVRETDPVAGPSPKRAPPKRLSCVCRIDK